MPDKSLVDFVAEVKGEDHLRIEHDYGDGFVRLHTSEAERRQAAQDIRCSEDIVLELLRNSRDAHASHVFLAISKEGAKRTLTVVDDGDGIPPAMHEKVFLPRVTSKLDTSHKDAWGFHGRGMALYSIAENSLEARIAASDTMKGTSLTVTTDTTQLPEKADQSSFPRFVMEEGGTVAVRGPKNIIRTAFEFAIEARNECSVYIGSTSEMLSSLYQHGISSLSAIDRAFCKDESALPLVKRLAIAADVDELAAMACALGLKVSKRTARRIMDGEVADPPSLLDQVVIERSAPDGKKARGGKGRTVKVQKEDLRRLGESVRAAYEPLAEQYYLDGQVEPRLRIASDKLVITLPLVEKL